MDIKDIFPEEDVIEFSDDFISKLELRMEKNSADAALLQTETRVIDIECVEEIPDGKLRIFINDVRFEAFFHHNNSKRLYVMFNGARVVNVSAKDYVPKYDR